MGFSSAERPWGDKNSRVVITALCANILIAVAKVTAASKSGSTAMLAEAAHSLADTGNEVTLFLGLRFSSRPADPEHPFGYGMERYFWTFMASIYLFIIGGSFSILEGIRRIFNPMEVEELWINFAVLGVSFLFDGVSFGLAFEGLRDELRAQGLWRSIRHTKDPTLFNVLFEDSAALLGLAFASLGLLLYEVTGNVIFDSLASLLIGLLLGGLAVLLGFESRSLLLGEAATPETKRRIVQAVHRVPEVIGVLQLLTMHMAPDDILINMDLNLRKGLTTQEIERAIDRVEEEIRKAVPQARRIFVECETSGRPAHDGSQRE